MSVVIDVGLDENRIRSILAADHSFYGSQPSSRWDSRFNPGAKDFVASHFTPSMRVLDIGCGNGTALLAHAERFSSGLGIDNDPAHLAMAEEAKAARGVSNVDFRLLDFDSQADELDAESFDFVFTERGPVGYHSSGVQAAVRLLMTDGMLFMEAIGELHHQEARELFGTARRRSQTISVLDQMKVAAERNGISIRYAADVVAKVYYPDVYEWLVFQCGIWSWSGATLPAADDVRLPLFAQRNRAPSGEIETTHHVCRVAGVKLPLNPYGGRAAARP